MGWVVPGDVGSKQVRGGAKTVKNHAQTPFQVECGRVDAEQEKMRNHSS